MRHQWQCCWKFMWLHVIVALSANSTVARRLAYKYKETLNILSNKLCQKVSWTWETRFWLCIGRLKLVPYLLSLSPGILQLQPHYSWVNYACATLRLSVITNRLANNWYPCHPINNKVWQCNGSHKSMTINVMFHVFAFFMAEWGGAVQHCLEAGVSALNFKFLSSLLMIEENELLHISWEFGRRKKYLKRNEGKYSNLSVRRLCKQKASGMTWWVWLELSPTSKISLPNCSPHCISHLSSPHISTIIYLTANCNILRCLWQKAIFFSKCFPLLSQAWSQTNSNQHNFNF